MDLTIALAGDTMLGRGVGELLADDPDRPVCAPEVVDTARAADLFVLNLECCISDRGTPWPDPGKPFFFRAPPSAAATLADLGVDAVTLANNHALDFGVDALLDTLDHLDHVGIAHAGAGADLAAARRPAVLDRGDVSVALFALSDHPAAFAAGETRPGIAFADLRADVPGWVTAAIGASDADIVVASPHWGPNMVAEPVPHVRDSATVVAAAGATLVAGHSAHVFQGVEMVGHCPVLYDLGDFVDDYAVDRRLRNDLGLLWLLTLSDGRATRLDALPLKLDFGYSRVADGADRDWIDRRLRAVVHPLPLTDVDGVLRITLGGR